MLYTHNERRSNYYVVAGIFFIFRNLCYKNYLAGHKKIDSVNFAFIILWALYILKVRSVILIRHAKSDHSLSKSDFERTIRADKVQDVVRIAAEIRHRSVLPDAVISSNARRTMQTAQILCQEWGIPEGDIIEAPKIYEGGTEDILDVIHRSDPQWNTIFIIGHNPALTDFVNAYSNLIIDNISTSSAVCITFDVTDWQCIETKGKVLWFLRP